MTQLVRYEQARTALAACHSVDEVKDIRDKAEAMAAYARQAKDQDLILWATEIRVRAERKAGEMILEKRSIGEMAGAGGDRRSETKVEQTSLKTYGISNDQGVRWTALAQMPSEHFEAAVATAKDTAGHVTAAFVLARGKPHGPPKKGAKADRLREELREARERGVSMLCSYARLTFNAINAQDEFSPEEQEAIRDLKTAIGRLPIFSH